MPFTFNAVDLYVVTINEKPCARVKEVYSAIEYSEKSKTATMVKNHCCKENFAQKYQMSSVHAVCTPVDWPKDSQKYDIYISKRKRCINCYFLVNSQKQKTSENTTVM